MAFCGKCGAETSGNAQFCPKCGAATVPGPNQQPVQKQDPQQDLQIKISNPFKKLSGATIISMAVSMYLLLLMFVPWTSTGYFSYSIFRMGFGISVMFGMTFILAWLTIAAFIFYLVVVFFDLDQYIKTGGSIKLRTLSGLIYYGTYALTMFFTLVSVIATYGVGMAFGWFVTLITFVFAFLLFLNPNMLKNFINYNNK